MAASVEFEVRHEFASSAEIVWTELVDWAGHANWIPATRVDIDAVDPTAVGTEFTATTGFGPLSLPDRMRVVRCVWNEEASSGDCEVEKIGPVLTGSTCFTVEPHGPGAVVVWLEDVTVPYAPQFLEPIIAWGGATGFRFGMRRLAKLLERRSR